VRISYQHGKQISDSVNGKKFLNTSSDYQFREEFFFQVDSPIASLNTIL
jgi:hypothetical protein